jgi:hypothetical protein
MRLDLVQLSMRQQTKRAAVEIFGESGQTCDGDNQTGAYSGDRNLGSIDRDLSSRLHGEFAAALTEKRFLACDRASDDEDMVGEFLRRFRSATGFQVGRSGRHHGRPAADHARDRALVWQLAETDCDGTAGPALTVVRRWATHASHEAG